MWACNDTFFSARFWFITSWWMEGEVHGKIGAVFKHMLPHRLFIVLQFHRTWLTGDWAWREGCDGSYFVSEQLLQSLYSQHGRMWNPKCKCHPSYSMNTQRSILSSCVTLVCQFTSNHNYVVHEVEIGLTSNLLVHSMVRRSCAGLWTEPVCNCGISTYPHVEWVENRL